MLEFLLYYPDVLYINVVVIDPVSIDEPPCRGRSPTV
jgi:hypothetical protein